MDHPPGFERFPDGFRIEAPPPGFDHDLRLLVFTSLPAWEQFMKAVYERVPEKVDFGRSSVLTVGWGWHGSTGYSIEFGRIERGKVVRIHLTTRRPKPDEAAGAAMTYATDTVLTGAFDPGTTFELYLDGKRTEFRLRVNPEGR